MLTSSYYGIYTPKKNFTSTLNKKAENRHVNNLFEK
jgi:hypothetical protein